MKSKKGFEILSHIVLIIMCVLCIVPFILLIVSSFTAETSLIANGYSFWPEEFSLDAYKYVIGEGSIFRAYGITLFVTAVGTAAALIITTLIAYPLSIAEIPGRNVVNFFVFFTMLFSGGLVPSYMMWTQIFGIKNTIWAYIVPGLITNGFTIMVMRSYFTANIPKEILESARVDGASEFKTLIKIVLPVSLPILATIGLMSGIAYWNDWTNGLYYVTEYKLSSVQVLLNRMLTNAQYLQQSSSYGTVSMEAIPTTGVRMAIAVIGAVPLMCIYPFFQKYFAKGMTLGAVKG